MRLIRLSFMLTAAFVAGMFVERAHQQDLCRTSGGQWLSAGICGEK
jgi:hypothetical protein